jgi:hypothetical protein
MLDSFVVIPALFIVKPGEILFYPFLAPGFARDPALANATSVARIRIFNGVLNNGRSRLGRGRPPANFTRLSNGKGTCPPEWCPT